MKPAHPTNTHHIIPRSRGGSEDRANKVEIDRRVHAALHEVFANDLPSEYFRRFSTRNTADFFFEKCVRAIARNWGIHHILRVLKDL